MPEPTTDVDSSAVNRFKERYKTRSSKGGTDDPVARFKERFKARQPKKEEPGLLEQVGEKISSLIPKDFTADNILDIGPKNAQGQALPRFLYEHLIKAPVASLEEGIGKIQQLGETAPGHLAEQLLTATKGAAQVTMSPFTVAQVPTEAASQALKTIPGGNYIDPMAHLDNVAKAFGIDAKALSSALGGDKETQEAAEGVGQEVGGVLAGYAGFKIAGAIKGAVSPAPLIEQSLEPTADLGQITKAYYERGKDAVRRTLSKNLTRDYSPEKMRDIFQKVNRGEGTPEDQNLVKTVNKVFASPGEAVRKGARTTTIGYHPLTPPWLRNILGEFPEQEEVTIPLRPGAARRPDVKRQPITDDVVEEIRKTAPTTADVIKSKEARGEDLTRGEQAAVNIATEKLSPEPKMPVPEKKTSDMTSAEFEDYMNQQKAYRLAKLEKHPLYQQVKQIADQAGMRLEEIVKDPDGTDRVRFTDDKGTYHTRSLPLSELTPENMKKEIARASAGRKLASEMTPEEIQKHFDEQRETNLRRASQNPLFEPARKIIEGMGGKVSGIFKDADNVMRIEFAGTSGGNTSLPLEGLTPELAKAELDKFGKKPTEPMKVQPAVPPPGTPLEEITAPVPGDRTINEVPLNSIDVDPSRFQPRVEGIDEELQQARVKAFDRKQVELNPIVVWRDPTDGRFKVLAGHHRHDLFNRVGEKTIPAVEFKGTEEEALHYAHNENARRKAETALDRANYYRNQRLRGVSEKDIRQALVSEVGSKGAHHVIALSYLNPDGKAINAMKTLTDTQSQSVARTMGEWIGDSRRMYPELTDVHENELFDFLKDQYGKNGARIKTEFIDRIAHTVDKLGVFDPSKPLNIKQLAVRSNLEQEYLDRVKAAEDAVGIAQKNHDIKLDSLTNPKVRQVTSQDVIDRVMKPYRDAVQIARTDLLRLKQNQDDALRQIRQQEQDLFSQENLTNADLARSENRTPGETTDSERADEALAKEEAALDPPTGDPADDAKTEELLKRNEAEIKKITGEAPPKIRSLDDPEIQKLPPENKSDLDDSVDGLDGLFGSPDAPPAIAEPVAGYNKPTTDEITYQKAKWHFDKSVHALKITGATETDVATILVDRYGEKIRPYVQRYLKDVEDEHDFRRGQAIFGATGRTGSFRRPSFRMVNSGNIPEAQETIPLGKYAIDEQQRYASNLALQRFETPGTGFGLFDGTGFGKTRQIIVIAAEHADRSGKRALVVVPNKQVLAINFADDMRALNIDPKNLELGTYDDLRTKKIGQGDYSLAVFDEGHKLKNPHSQRAIASSLVKADNFLYSTATPMDGPAAASYFMSKITGIPEKDVQTQLGYQIVEIPDQRTGQMRRFAELLPGHSWADVTDAIIRMRDQAISSGAMIRREYPFYGTVGTHPVTLSSDDLTEQRQIDDYWNRRISYARNPRARMNLAGQRVQELSRWVERLKAPAIIEAAMNDMKEGRSVVILGQQYSDTQIKGLGGKTVQGIITIIANELKNQGIPFAQIYGGGDKSKAVNDFQNNKVRIAIATPESGGTGINLDDVTGTAPRTMYIATDNFSGDVFDQIMGRVSRRNTQTPVALKHVRSSESLSDTRRGQILDRKLDVLRRIQTGEDPDRVSLESSEELSKLFGERGAGVAEPQGQYDLFTNPNTKEVKTQSGDVIKHRSALDEGVLKRHPGQQLPASYRTLKPGEFSALDRRFSRYKQLKFTKASERIESSADVAYLMRTLEDKTIEHALVVMVRSDGKAVVQHLTTGTFDASDIDLKAINPLITAFGPKEIYFVHNHPTGILTPSDADVFIMSRMLKAFSPKVLVNDGILIDGPNGQFATFSETGTVKTGERAKTGANIPVKALTFDRQVYLNPVAISEPVKSPIDVAKFVGASQFSSGEKLQLLSLNTRHHIVGRFFLDTPFSDANVENLRDEIGNLVARSGGTSAVLVGNRDVFSDRVQKAKLVRLHDSMMQLGMSLHDYISVQSGADVETGRGVESAASVGFLRTFTKQKLSEPASGYYRSPKKHPEEIKRDVAKSNLKNALDQTGMATEDVDAFVRRIGESGARGPNKRDIQTIQDLLGDKGKTLVENYRQAIEEQKTAKAEARRKKMSQAMMEKAVEEFGEADGRRETGYILPDGTALDFSGKREGGLSGRRSLDHREIGRMGVDMYEFMDMGAIRTMPEVPAIYLRQPPTSQQKTALKGFLSSMTSPTVELYDHGKHITKDFFADDPVEDIVDYIDRFYAGKIRPPREIDKFREPGAEYKSNPVVRETKGDALNPETQKLDAVVSLPKDKLGKASSGIPRFEEIRGMIDDFTGKTLPRITRSDNRAGDLGARWANSWQTGQFVSDDFGDRVLSTGVDDKKLGAVLTEDRLRGIKDRNQREITDLTTKRDAETDLGKRADLTMDIANLQDEIDNIKSVVGAENSPLATEEDFQNAINDPTVQDALNIIKRDIEPWQEEKFRKAAYIPDDAELPKRGKHLDTSMSLFPVDPTDQSIDKSAIIRWGQGPGSNLPASLRRRTLLARRAKGTAEQYSISFRDMLRNQVAKVLSIANKKEFEDRLIETGDAKISRPGQKIDLKGEPAREFALRRGKLNQSLYVRSGLAGEYWRLENRDDRFNMGIARHVVRIFNQAALTSLLEPVAHGINLMSLELSKPGVGGDAVRAKLTAIGGLPDLVTAVERFIKKSIDSPEAKKRLAALSDMGVSFRSPHEVLNPFLKLTGKQIHTADLKVRLMLDDAFQYLVDKGVAQDTPTNRREFINQAGVYNRNVYGKVNRFFKDTGLSPFITATRAFTVSSIRNIGLQPGMKATSAGAAAGLRFTMLTKIIGTVGTIALLNYLTTKDKNGGAGGRPGTPLLTWDTGMDFKDGSHVTIDVGRFFGLSRGLRSLGVKGYVEGRMKGLSEGEAISAATRDMINSGLGMVAGPVVRFGTEAITGYPPAVGVSRLSPVAAPDQSQVAQNVKTAFTETNPAISFLLSPKVQTDETRVKQTLPFVGGSPAEQKVKNYPRAVHGAEFNKFLDDVATNSRKVPRQNRMKYIQKRLEDLEPADRAKAMHELLLRRRVLLAK